MNQEISKNYVVLTYSDYRKENSIEILSCFVEKQQAIDYADNYVNKYKNNEKECHEDTEEDDEEHQGYVYIKGNVIYDKYIDNCMWCAIISNVQII